MATTKADAAATRANLIATGVRKLRDLGHPDVNEDNILKDAVYKGLFWQSLSVTMDCLAETSADVSIYKACESILAELMRA
jgi:hypothetical protein